MKETQLQSLLSKVDEQIERQDYSGARQLLQSIDISHLSGADLAYYLIVKTHTDIYLGSYRTENIDTALELAQVHRLDPLLARARLLKGLALDKQGNYSDALQHYLEASVRYRNLGDFEYSAVAVNLLAWTHYRVGDYNAARKNYLEALKSLSSIRKSAETDLLRRKERDMAHNLANLEIQFGRIRKGLADYDDYPISRNELDNDSARNYFLNRAKGYALCRDIDACRESLERCKPFLKDRDRFLSMYWQWMGLSHYCECQFDSAVDCFAKAEESLKDTNSDQMAGILRWKGECFWFLNEYDEAEKCAKRVLDLAIQTRERTEIAASYRLLALVNTSRSKTSDAKKHFEDAINLFESLGSQYELAKTQQFAGCSGVFPVEQCRDFLKKANIYFDREQIPRLSNRHTEDILMNIAILRSNPAQKKKITEILETKSIS